MCAINGKGFHFSAKTEVFPMEPNRRAALPRLLNSPSNELLYLRKSQMDNRELSRSLTQLHDMWYTQRAQIAPRWDDFE